MSALEYGNTRIDILREDGSPYYINIYNIVH